LEAAGVGNWRPRRSQILEGWRGWRRGVEPLEGDGLRRCAGSQKGGRGFRITIFDNSDNAKLRLQRVVVAEE